MSKVPLKKLDRTSRAKHLQKKTLPFITLTKLIVLSLKTLMIMKSNKTIMKENIIPPNYGDLIKPKILLEAHLTPLSNNRVICGRGDTRHGMSPFSTVNSRDYDARGECNSSMRCCKYKATWQDRPRNEARWQQNLFTCEKHEGTPLLY